MPLNFLYFNVRKKFHAAEFRLANVEGPQLLQAPKFVRYIEHWALTSPPLSIPRGQAYVKAIPAKRPCLAAGIVA